MGLSGFGDRGTELSDAANRLRPRTLDPLVHWKVNLSAIFESPSMVNGGFQK